MASSVEETSPSSQSEEIPSTMSQSQTVEKEKCKLCECIQNGHLQHVNRLLVELGDHDNKAIYNIIKYYQSYLNFQPNSRHVTKSDLWRMPNISQSETRLQVLDTLRVLLKSGLDPNISTGSETPLMAAVRTHDESFISLLLKHGADPNQNDGREDMNAFALSIILNDVTVVEKLLRYGANINSVCCGGMTPLQLSMNKSVLISKLLLQSGADIQQVLRISTPNDLHVTGSPIVTAVKGGNLYLTSVLLEHGEDVNQVYEENSLLHMAVKGDNYDMVELLIQYGANLNKLNGRGHSPIGLSLLKGGNRISRLLLDSGCSRKKETFIAIFHRSYPPMFAACFTGRTEIVEMLLDENEDEQRLRNSQTELKTSEPPKGDSIPPLSDHAKSIPRIADAVKGINESKHQVQNFKPSSIEETLDSKGNPDTETSKQKGLIDLHVSDQLDCENARSKLREKSESETRTSFINWETSDCSTPLMMAVSGGHYDLVLNLLHRGADPTISSCHGNLVHAAVTYGGPKSLELVKLAVDLGCSVNRINDQGNTPLHLSARVNQRDICGFLVSQGALLNVKDRFGETALSASVYFGCNANSELLIQHGADPDLADTSGTTALYWSIFNCRETTLRLLLTAGATFTPEQFRNYPRNLKVMRDLELLTFIKAHVHQPRPLIDIAVSRVRSSLSHLTRGRSICDPVMSLPVPQKVKDKLMLVQH